MEGLTLERNPINVSNVGKATFLPVPFMFMKELLPERNPVDVSNVGETSLIPVTFEA
jgi:hypothetical protein